MVYTTINKSSVDHSSDVSHCFAGEDTEYQPLREEESSSGSGGASDSDFSVSSPPQKTKAAAKPKHQRTATAIKRPTGEGERKKRTREVGADINKDSTKSSSMTVVRTTKPHVKRVTAVATQSPKNTTAVESRSSSQPAAGCNGTPGLGMRRMPHWTPPGEGHF